MLTNATESSISKNSTILPGIVDCNNCAFNDQILRMLVVPGSLRNHVLLHQEIERNVRIQLRIVSIARAKCRRWKSEV